MFKEVPSRLRHFDGRRILCLIKPSPDSCDRHYRTKVRWREKSMTLTAELAVMTSLTNPLTDLGLPPTTIESYVPKSEYPLLLELRAEPPWGVDGE